MARPKHTTCNVLLTMCATVLVIDDNPEISDLFSTCLRLCGLEAIVAHTLQEAYDICAQKNIDAILVDFNLPDGKGPEILARLGEKCPKVRLLISGYDISKEDYPGFDEYLMKPVDCGYICSRICAKVNHAHSG
jgi:DNA-binding response OmpR family regulator